MKKRVVIFAITFFASHACPMMKSDSMSSFLAAHSLPASRSNSSTNLVQLAQGKKERCCCAFVNRIFESLANTAPTPINPPPIYFNIQEEKTKSVAQSSAPLD